MDSSAGSGTRETMTKKKAKPAKAPKLRPDANEIAFRVLQEAIGERPKTVPGQGPKNPEAVSRGSKGGKKGGKARAEALTPEEREAAAQVAALARWKKTSPD